MPAQKKANASPVADPTLGLPPLNWNAAGIDVGSTEHWVAVPPGREPEPVRCFQSFTADLHRLADWLAACGVETVAMESTGVYWLGLFQVLEARGFAVQVVDARRAKSLPGRKSDLLDCQWLQKLHTFGGCSPAAFGRPLRSVGCAPTGVNARPWWRRPPPAFSICKKR